MNDAPIKENEADRLKKLRSYQILDTPAAAEFDDFTRLASYICGTPIALISLVDMDRQWFKSRVGLDALETPRDISFCGHAIHGQDIFEIPNALEDPRFCDNPLVTSAPDIRFYAGAPLLTPEGYGIGTLCVIDRVPHVLTDAQRDALRVLAQRLVQQLEFGLTLRREQERSSAQISQAAFLKALVGSAGAAVISGRVDGIITSFNPAAEKMLGYAADELIGKETLGIFHDLDEVVARAAELSTELGRPIEPGFEVFVAKARTGKPETHEWTYRGKDGRAIQVQLTVSAIRDEAGVLTGFLGVAQDITVRKQTEASIQELTLRLRLAMASAHMGIWDWDIENNSLVWDGRMFELYGVSPDVFGGAYSAWLAGVVDEDKECADRAIQDALEDKAPYDIEFRVRWSDGSLHWVKADGLVLRNAAGKAVRMVGINYDITTRKQTEQMKAEFVSTVSHELRTPLTSISGSLGLVVGGALGEVPALMKPMLDIAHKNSLRLTRLINDLLDIEKLSAGKIHFDFQVQPLMPLIEQTLESLHAYGAQLGVGFDLAERTDDVQVRVDGSRLQQVLSNFLSNAAKFSPTGGRVELRVIRQDKVVRVDVIDRGTGIPEEFRTRIFQKFAQADSSDTRQKGGTGLGLAISKELIERMNGLVGFTSEPGRTCFHFELPVWQEPAALKTALASDVLAGSPRLLVVEDEPDIGTLLATLFSGAGYQVDVAPDGETALRLLTERAYTAMTLDLMLPDQSGAALIREIRRNPQTEHLPVIVVSAYAEDGKLSIKSEFNVLDWVDKPFNQDRLLSAVQSIVDDQPAHPEGGKLRILHVEDDADLATVVATLTASLAQCDSADSLAAAREQLKRRSYQVVILDIGLPDGTGWELLTQLRAMKPAPAVIVLSGAEVTAEQQDSVHSALIKSPNSVQELLSLIQQFTPLTEARQGEPTP